MLNMEFIPFPHFDKPDNFEFLGKQVLDDDTNVYIWEIKVEHYWRGFDYFEETSWMVQRYLKICTNKEIAQIGGKQHFLRIKCYEDSGKKTSCIRIMCLTIDGLEDTKYQELLRSCQIGMFPCEITIGPFWHYFGVDKIMCNKRHLGMGYIIPFGYAMGIKLFGRDAFPDEDEATIKEREISEGIFIVRK